MSSLGLCFEADVQCADQTVGGIVAHERRHLAQHIDLILRKWIDIGTFVALFSGIATTQVIQAGTKWVLQNLPLWMIVFVVLGVLRLVAQIQNDRRFEVATYNRLTTSA